MKKLLVISALLVAAPAWAAKINNPNCKDLDQISDKYTPEYLAVVDGYDKAGKRIGTEVDIAGIVNESDKIKEECGKNKTAKVATVQHNVAKANTSDAASDKPTTKINPTKAKCEDFIALGERYQPLAAFWVAGHTKTGKAKNGEIDEEFLAQPVATLVEDCKATPTASFYDKTKTWLKKHI